MSVKHFYFIGIYYIIFQQILTFSIIFFIFFLNFGILPYEFAVNYYFYWVNSYIFAEFLSSQRSILIICCILIYHHLRNKVFCYIKNLTLMLSPNISIFPTILKYKSVSNSFINLVSRNICINCLALYLCNASPLRIILCTSP